MTKDDDGNCAPLGEVAVYVAAGLDPETPTCEVCGTDVPARFRLTRPGGRVMRLCVLHLLTSVDMLLNDARQEVGRLLSEFESS